VRGREGATMREDEPGWATAASWALAGALAPGALCSDLLLCVLERALGARPPWSQRLALAGGITTYALSIFAAAQFWAGASSSSSTGLFDFTTTPILQFHISITPTIQSALWSAMQCATALAISTLLAMALALRLVLTAPNMLGTSVIVVLTTVIVNKV